MSLPLLKVKVMDNRLLEIFQYRNLLSCVSDSTNDNFEMFIIMPNSGYLFLLSNALLSFYFIFNFCIPHNRSKYQLNRIIWLSQNLTSFTLKFIGQKGVQAVHAVYPYVTIITGEVDAGLNDKVHRLFGSLKFGCFICFLQALYCRPYDATSHVLLRFIMWHDMSAA